MVSLVGVSRFFKVVPHQEVVPPHVGVTDEQVLALNQAGIQFLNNSWSKVAPLPGGGYSVVTVDVRAELVNLERSRSGDSIRKQLRKDG